MKSCECGCGGESARTFLPGHDQKLRIALEKQAGGLLPLRALVEAAKSFSDGEMSDVVLCRTVRSILS